MATSVQESRTRKNTPYTPEEAWTGLHSWVGQHLACHPRCHPFFLVFYASDKAGRHRRPDPFQCSWKGGGILTVCFISRLASHFQEILRLRTMENRRNRERVTAQTLNAGPDKTYKKCPALGWAKHFQTQTQPPSLAIVQIWKFPFCREIWWEMWLGVQDEIMFRSQLLSWIRFFQIVKLNYQ